MPKQTTDEPQAERRSTEGSRPGAVARGKGPQTGAARRGRPAGSKNKPKSLIPADIAAQLMELMRERLPGEHYDYMKGVIVRGESIATDREVDMLITLVRGSLMPYLAIEAMPVPEIDPETGEVKFDDEGREIKRFPGINRDVTDRLKLLNSLLTLKEGIEKRKAKEDDDSEQPLIVKVFNARNLGDSRLGLLLGGADAAGGPVEAPRLVGGSD